MRRREFITLLGSTALTWPLTVRAQQPEQMRRVSVLLGLGEKDPEATSRVKAFRLAMRDLGWINGRNIQIEIRFAGSDPASIKEHVAQTVQLAPDVIVANSIPVMTALHLATKTIPIVFANVSNPVGRRFHFKRCPSGRQYHRIFIHRARNYRKMDQFAQGRKA
jgi:putative ABC transport system substrate-binding protein